MSLAIGASGSAAATTVPPMLAEDPAALSARLKQRSLRAVVVSPAGRLRM